MGHGLTAHQASDMLRAEPERAQTPDVPSLLDLRQVGSQYE